METPNPRVPRTPSLLSLCALLVLLVPTAVPAEDTDDRIRSLEDTVRALKDEVGELRAERRSDRLRLGPLEGDMGSGGGLFGRVEIGGYGSMRFENSSVSEAPSTFTLRRMVLTTAADITERLRFYSELEYERFRKLELERETRPVSETEGVPDGIKLVQEVEGTNESEIALEQVWLEFDLNDNLRTRMGGVLVPLGRFNLNHDDNRWNLTRRSLVDRGAPVLPSTAAWDEMGVGLLGDVPVGEGSLAWEFYVVNGVTLEAELEVVATIRDQPGGKRDKIELELEFTPQTGTFSNDIKEAKAVTGRLAWRPAPGQELAVSFYRGRYTPRYLTDETLWSVAVDGITEMFGLEVEGEYVFTRYDGVRSVAQSLASVALESKVATGSLVDPNFETEIEVDIKNLADAKHGYWVEVRRPFWPAFLSGTFLGRGFESPALIPVVRWEQVFFLDRLKGLGFSGGALTEFETENRVLSRLTAALAYRPMPLAAFTLAYEYLFANGDSLDGLTNYLPSGIRDDSVHTLTLGATFGF